MLYDVIETTAEVTTEVQNETMPAWAVIMVTLIFAVTFLILTLIYMPRIEEIMRLHKIIKTLRRTITRMSKEQTTAELEHIADIGYLSERALAAEKKKDQIAVEYEEKLTKANARKSQSSNLRKQIAKAADKIRQEAVI